VYQKKDIAAAIKQFSSSSLRDNCINLFSLLGYNTTRQGMLESNTFQGFEDAFLEDDQGFDKVKALSMEWEKVELLFQLTEEEMDFSNNPLAKEIKFKKLETEDDKVVINSYLFFAIELSKETYTSRQLSQVTREINRIFPMPVMIMFLYGSNVTMSVIDRRLNKKDREKDVLVKVVLIKDININNPHRGQIDILSSLSSLNLLVSNFAELHEAWRKVLNISELNRNFYKDITMWFYSAISIVNLPDKPEYIKDKYEHNKNFLVRLLSRIMFCWFLKEKGVIDKKILELVDLNGERYPILRDINEKGFPDSNSYYRGILQNVFYKCLNEEKKNRKIHFEWTKYLPDDFDYSMFMGIPYINGGTFDAMPEDNADGSITDEDISIPNKLFYGDGGLNTILSNYKFTIEENTPLDEDIALDPELLGLVFENLLAELDPNVDDAILKNIRKQTGSYYTPRKVIEVMVNESLYIYLKKYVDSKYSSKSDYKQKVSSLIYFDIADVKDNEFCESIVDALDLIKILDPACGSGAFPMGMLQRMIKILSLVDPSNEIWIDKQVQKVDPVFRNALKMVIEEHLDDYSRKLGIIRNCIYGIDIQPLAVQITKLRFFISLIVEQKVDLSRKNLGIIPMPNLETKIICADSLSDIKSDLIVDINKLIDKRERYYQHSINHLEKNILADEIVTDMDYAFPKFSSEVIGRNKEGDNKRLLKEWFMHGTVSAPFFNAKYFFPEVTIQGGFDVIIGNPPYGGQKISDALKRNLGLGSGDIYGAFIARFLNDIRSPIKSGGVLAYIVSDTFMTIKTHKQLRQQMMKHKIHKMIRVHPDTFKATVNTAIIICERSERESESSHICQMVDMTNVSFHKNYDRFIEILRKVVEMQSRENISNEEYAIYYYNQNLIRLNSNLPFFVASPKLFALLQDERTVKTEIVEIDEIMVQARIININGKGVKVVKLEDIAEVKVGLQTGDNPSYLFQNPNARGKYRSIEQYRGFLLTQDDMEKIQSNEKLRSEIIHRGISQNDKRSKRYFGGRYIIPYDKGGESDVEEGWMPNYYVPTNYFIDWSELAVNRMRTLTIAERITKNNENKQITTKYKVQVASVFRNVETYFMQGISFSDTGFYAPTFRIGSASIYDVMGMTIFFREKEDIYFILGLLCSKLAKYIIKNYINHTVHTQVEGLKPLSIVVNADSDKQHEISKLVSSIIQNQKYDRRHNYATNEQIRINRLVYEMYNLNLNDIEEIEDWYVRRYPRLR
jgi:hypothetical protein